MDGGGAAEVDDFPTGGAEPAVPDPVTGDGNHHARQSGGCDDPEVKIGSLGQCGRDNRAADADDRQVKKFDRGRFGQLAENQIAGEAEVRAGAEKYRRADGPERDSGCGKIGDGTAKYSRRVFRPNGTQSLQREAEPQQQCGGPENHQCPGLNQVVSGKECDGSDRRSECQCGVSRAETQRRRDSKKLCGFAALRE